MESKSKRKLQITVASATGNPTIVRKIESAIYQIGAHAARAHMVDTIAKNIPPIHFYIIAQYDINASIL